MTDLDPWQEAGSIAQQIGDRDTAGRDLIKPGGDYVGGDQYNISINEQRKLPEIPKALRYLVNRELQVPSIEDRIAESVNVAQCGPLFFVAVGHTEDAHDALISRYTLTMMPGILEGRRLPAHRINHLTIQWPRGRHRSAEAIHEGMARLLHGRFDARPAGDGAESGRNETTALEMAQAVVLRRQEPVTFVIKFNLNRVDAEDWRLLRKIVSDWAPFDKLSTGRGQILTFFLCFVHDEDDDDSIKSLFPQVEEFGNVHEGIRNVIVLDPLEKVSLDHVESWADNEVGHCVECEWIDTYELKSCAMRVFQEETKEALRMKRVVEIAWDALVAARQKYAERIGQA